MRYVIVLQGSHSYAQVQAYRYAPGAELTLTGQIDGGAILLWEVPAERAEAQADRLMSGWIGAKVCDDLAQAQAWVLANRD